MTRQPLSYEVLISDPIPFATSDPVPNGDRRMFSPLSSTLIVGEHDVVLVDPPMTTAQAKVVADWIADTGKRLIHIFVTHGHGDHWFGTGPLVARFPEITVVAAPGTIQEMAKHASAEVRAQIWDRGFPGQIPEAPVLAEPVDGNVFYLEGQALRIIEVGHSDTDNTTALHVPSIGLLVAGDVVYNGVHQYLSESAGGGLEAWLRALDIVAGLKPTHVVSGHKNKALPDEPVTIDETRRYLQDAQRLVASSHTALEFFEAMLNLYPGRLNSGAIWGGAQALFR